MEALNYVFQVDSKIVEDAYIQKPNYLIEFSEKSNHREKYCILYFSSNDIYYPNDEQVFKSLIIDKNRFEWYNKRITKGDKHIFIRDIKKQWYLTGINQKINTIEKLSNFLRSETDGYKIIALGSSAGGFAAVLLGSMLNAETILTFNGQFMLSDLLSSSCKRVTNEMLDPIVFREKDNPDINKYYSLKPYIKNPKIIYYFYSIKSGWDLDQYKHISELKIQFVPFLTSHHGIPFLKSNLDDVLNLAPERILKFVGKTNNPILFSIKIGGLFKTINDLTSLVFKLISRKIIKPKLR